MNFGATKAETVLKKKRLHRRYLSALVINAALAMFLSGNAAAATGVLPLKKPKPQNARAGIAKVVPASEIKILPIPKPDFMGLASVDRSRMMTAALEEGARATSFIGKVFNTLTAKKRLSEDDAARYQHIFVFQENGQISRADAEVAKLEDHRLMGYVLAQRYLSPNYKTSYSELAGWLDRYADHPQASKIHELAVRKRSSGDRAPRAPVLSRGVSGQHDFDVGQLAQPYLSSRKLSPREKDIAKAIRGHLAERPTAALKRLETDEVKTLFNHAEYDALKAEIAESYFYNGKPEKALDQAVASLTRSGKDVPKAGWIAGLSAWKIGQYADAAKYFEVAAKSKRSSAWMVSAASYWAARAHLRSHSPEKVSKWLSRAASYPRTFYGIIAMKAMGAEHAQFDWSLPELTDKRIKNLAAHEAGRRALALFDAGRPDLAEMEMTVINPGKNHDLQTAMIALAAEAGLPKMAMRLGSAFKSKDGTLFDGALYPDVPWAPEEGFAVDRALVYAFIRQESRFDAQATNRSSGATGLMQLMPATAKHVAGKGLDIRKLSDPQVNIDIGQQYLAELLANENVDNNLFKLAVAYNAGPGKLARWNKVANYNDDPLMFIESIPAAETRIFVERVLANYWIYRLKFDQDTESLDKVAEGGWPVYVAHDIQRGISLADAAKYFSR